MRVAIRLLQPEEQELRGEQMICGMAASAYAARAAAEAYACHDGGIWREARLRRAAACCILPVRRMLAICRCAAADARCAMPCADAERYNATSHQRVRYAVCPPCYAMMVDVAERYTLLCVYDAADAAVARAAVYDATLAGGSCAPTASFSFASLILPPGSELCHS